MIAYTGEAIYPKNTGVPSLESIGISLGRLPRFAGHTKIWYPVLAHTMVVVSLVRDKYKIHALMHDTPEICVADVPTPWKTAAARKREKMLLRRMYKHYDIAPMTQAEQEAVDNADALALAAEAHVLGHPAAHEIWPNPSKEAMKYTTEWLVDRLKGIEDPDFSAAIFTDAFTLWHTPHIKGKESIA